MINNIKSISFLIMGILGILLCYFIVLGIIYEDNRWYESPEGSFEEVDANGAAFMLCMGLFICFIFTIYAFVLSVTYLIRPNFKFEGSQV